MKKTEREKEKRHREMPSQKTKPGPHGVLRRWSIRYRDEDPACPVFTWSVWAYDEEHAIERFLEGPDAEGWVVLGIEGVNRA